MRTHRERQQDWRYKTRQRIVAALRSGRHPPRPDKASIHSKGAWARGEGAVNNSKGGKR